MFGNNPKRKPLKGNGSELQIQDIFATIQGECIYTGWPAIFIRLGGCNLACSFCDTEFESFSTYQTSDIISQVDKLSGLENSNHIYKLCVITGGEPLRQPIEPLCEILLEKGYKVQIESNGTLYRKLDPRVEIICSPKNTGAGYGAVREDLAPYIKAFKFLISANNPLYNSVTEIGQTKFAIPVYIQPMDEYDASKNQQNIEKALALSHKYGYRISLQTHKILGID